MQQIRLHRTIIGIIYMKEFYPKRLPRYARNDREYTHMGLPRHGAPRNDILNSSFT